MASFSIKGPYNIPLTKEKVGRRITKDNIKEFWADHETIAFERGCYVFGFRASKGLKPMYAGKATKTFKQEVFADHKLKRYAEALGSQAKGTPIFFFITLNQTKGNVNKTAIDEVESFLIQYGLVANKSLLNDKKTAVESWSIGGLIRSKGKPSNAAVELKRMFKI